MVRALLAKARERKTSRAQQEIGSNSAISSVSYRAVQYCTPFQVSISRDTFVLDSRMLAQNISKNMTFTQ